MLTVSSVGKLLNTMSWLKTKIYVAVVDCSNANLIFSFEECEDTNGKCIDHGQQNTDGCTCNISGTRTEYICDGYGK